MILSEQDYAPVFIPTLCRYEHFKRCVDSLSRCIGAKYTTLIIGLDYPLKEIHWEGYHKIKEYIPSISGFKEVIVLERTENYGSKRNGDEAFKYIYDRYDRMILTEDDNEFSPNFLEYINKGLIQYKNNPNVFAICGYMYPFDIHMDNNNAFWGTGYSAWGTGLWRDKHLKIRTSFNKHGIEEILNSWHKSFLLFINSPKDLNSLMTMCSKNLIWGDVLICSMCFLENRGSIFPVKSKVRNWGDDGSGLHSIRNLGLSRQEIDNNDTFDYHMVNTELKRFTPHKLPFWIKGLIICRYLFYRLTRKDLLAYHYNNRRE